jgi:TPR repeat protein
MRRQIFALAGLLLLAFPALAQRGDEANPAAGISDPPPVVKPATRPAGPPVLQPVDPSQPGIVSMPPAVKPPAAPAPPAPAASTPATPPATSPAPAAAKPTPPAAAPATPQADPPRAGMAKAWGELLAADKARQAAAKPEPEPSGRVLGVGTGRGQGGKPPELSESDKACQRSLQQLMAEAEKGNAQSAFRVGIIYEEGCGVRRSGQTAAAYYELAGKHGHVDGAVRLGGFYAQGDVLGTDYKKARALLDGPAAKGHPLANFHLGVIAYRGDETKPSKPDIPLAMKHFKASAEGGFAQSQFIVGQALVEGKELPQDLKAAKAMLQRASNQGFSWAMVILGRLHAEKLLADADPAEAFKWLMLAKHGEPGDSLLQSVADQSLPLLDGKLNPDQRGRIMKQVFDFKPKIEWEEKI